MIKVTLWHSPEGFHFWILGGREIPVIAAQQFEGLNEEKFLCLDGGVAVGVVSEFSEIPIRIEFDRFGPDPVEHSSWDRIVECSLEVTSDAIEFESAVAETFGRLEVPSGLYRIRICYGGQSTVQPDGGTEDFYLIQIWPSDQRGARLIKS